MQCVEELKSFCRRPITVIVAGGGTGGHLFPGIAVGQAFAEEDDRNRILFVGSGRPLEKEVLDHAGFPQKTINIEGIKGRGLWSRLQAIMKIPGAMLHSRRIFVNSQADLVISVGGYAAGPVALAAWMTGIPMVICEQNTVPGITNRILFPFAKRIYVSFENTRGKIDPQKLRITGNPIRHSLFEVESVEKSKNRPFTVLVVGGSQGAQAINRAVVDAIPLIERPEKISFIHQTGAADRKEVERAYKDGGIDARVNDFFHDMASCYSRADLVICRSGATTIAELTALGKAALFIPYPFAADNHQELNARELVDQGAGRMVLEKDLTGESLVRIIDRFIENPDLSATMASRSKRLGKPNAAKVIVDDCYELLGHKQ